MGFGSGTTPTLVGNDFVAISDNADGQVNVVVYHQPPWAACSSQRITLAIRARWRGLCRHDGWAGEAEGRPELEQVGIPQKEYVELLVAVINRAVGIAALNQVPLDHRVDQRQAEFRIPLQVIELFAIQTAAPPLV